MKVRIISAVIGLLLLIGGIWLGGKTLTVLFTFISIILNLEFKYSNNYIFRLDDIITTIFISLMFYSSSTLVLALIILFVFVQLIMCILIKRVNLSTLKLSLFSLIYSTLPFLLLHRFIYLSDPKLLFVLVFIIAWSTDTFAFFTGVFFGRTKIFGKISPSKTLEGSIGGLIGSVLLSLIFGLIFLKTIPFYKILIISFFGSIVAQLGDLVASYIKREIGIKDFGFILPGHGGLLDRFDSIIITVAYLFIVTRFL